MTDDQHLLEAAIGALRDAIIRLHQSDNMYDRQSARNASGALDHLSAYFAADRGRAVVGDPRKIADHIVQEVAELGDRTSPDDWPEAMLVTGEELHSIVLEALAPGEMPAPEATTLTQPDDAVVFTKEMANLLAHLAGSVETLQSRIGRSIRADETKTIADAAFPPVASWPPAGCLFENHCGRPGVNYCAHPGGGCPHSQRVPGNGDD